jgi:hypothetical protein
VTLEEEKPARLAVGLNLQAVSLAVWVMAQELLERVRSGCFVPCE